MTTQSNSMSGLPEHNVPSIQITADDMSPDFFESGMLVVDSYYSPLNQSSFNDRSGLYGCSQGLMTSSYTAVSSSPFDLEELNTDLPQLDTTLLHQQQFLSGADCTVPYNDSMFSQESNSSTHSDSCLSPAAFHNLSPASSYGGSLSPASYSPVSYSSDWSLSPSDIESPVTPEVSFSFTHPIGPIRRRGSFSAISGSHPTLHGSSPSDSVIQTAAYLTAQPPIGHHRSKSMSSIPRPVASPAMLEANSRRRRHPAQHTCEECGQTFTALFSLKRHTQSHSGERPYTCSIAGCGQQFFNSSDCKRHEKSRKRHKDLAQ